jgi:hypothetical protein
MVKPDDGHKLVIVMAYKSIASMANKPNVGTSANAAFRTTTSSKIAAALESHRIIDSNEFIFAGTLLSLIVSL